jgi:hypothetical protein
MRTKLFAITFITALLSTALLSSLALPSASASESSDFLYDIESEYDWWTGETIEWVTITGYRGPGGDVVIPSEIDGLPVTKIADNAFDYCDSMTSVTIPDSVTYIGYGAFTMCRSLTTATIGGGVTELEGTFILCFNLQNVTIGSSVTHIYDNAFGYCYALPSITIPASVTMIGAFSFQYCFDLKSIYFEGNAPVLEHKWDFERAAISGSILTAYFYHGATGFTTPSWNGMPSVKLPRAPSAPQDLMVKPGDGNVTLFWDAPANDGGDAVDHYVVYMNGTEVMTTVNRTVAVEGLVNGVDYFFTVAAHNAAGIGALSDEALASPSDRLLTSPSPVHGVGGISDEQVATNQAVMLGGLALISIAAVIAGFAVARQGAAHKHEDENKK